MYTIDSEEEDLKENLESEVEEEPGEEEKEIKKKGSDPNESIAFYPPPVRKKSKKTLYLILILILILSGLGFMFKHQIKSLVSGSPKPTPASTATPAPTPTSNPLIRSEWSFEVLNGTTTSSQAKKLADKLIALGYPVVKVGNADKRTYEITEILVKADLKDKLNLVVADIKDTVKIASMAGELQEGTASARIIIGKDSI